MAIFCGGRDNCFYLFLMRRGVMQFGQIPSTTTFYGPASNATSHGHMHSLMGSAFNEGILLSSRDPHPIAEIPSDPRLTPYRSSNSIPTILRNSNTTLTKNPKLRVPPKPSDALLLLSKLQKTLENPNHISVFICLHHSVLVLLNSEFVFISSSQFSPFGF